MRSEVKRYSVKELIDRDVIDRPLDGNHGEKHPKAKDYVSEGIPFLMAKDIENGIIDFSTCSFITEKQASLLPKGRAKSGDVLLTHKAIMGKTAIIPEGYPLVILTPQITYYRVKDKTVLSPDYLRYYFNSPKFQNILEAWSSSGSTRKFLSITDQLKLPIEVPPISLQMKVVKVIGIIDKEIDVIKKTNQKLNFRGTAYGA